GLGAGRIAAGVRDHHLDGAAGELVAPVTQEGGDALLAVNAAGGERPGLDREHADLDRRVLRDRRHRKSGCARECGGTGKHSASADTASHEVLPRNYVLCESGSELFEQIIAESIGLAVSFAGYLANRERRTTMVRRCVGA